MSLSFQWQPNCHQHCLSILRYGDGIPGPHSLPWRLGCKVLLNIKVELTPECVILCPAFCSIMSFELYSELHISKRCQLVDAVIPKPKLSIRVSKTKFVVSPIPGKILPWISKVTTPLDYLQDKT